MCFLATHFEKKIKKEKRFETKLTLFEFFFQSALKLVQRTFLFDINALNTVFKIQNLGFAFLMLDSMMICKH